MALVASEVRVAGTGEVFVAPADTAAPADSSATLAAPWVGLGYTTDSGVTISRTVEREGINAWQSVTPVRFVYTSTELTVAAEFIQSNNVLARLQFGIDEFEAGTGDELSGDIPVVPEQDIRALVVEWRDGDVSNRLWIPKVEVTETGDTALNRGAATGTSLTFTAVAPSSGSTLATWLTNDPSFAA